MRKIKHISSFLILLVMTFLFLHSELDFFSPENHIHSTHDFCEIITGAKTENIDINKSGILNLDICNISYDIPVFTSTIALKTFIIPQKAITGTNFRILYSSFLI
ncbi:MAG: hypothetical protein PHN88_04460 [Ignavibacteria bacterium]|nr:hypothetical protein [Ignavibacteria bacterium]